ncbi:MAG: NAD(P)-dependent oxidoreductase [Candidatus Cloacimonetes bacterium]|nr:NAD(P)-dependent oxidoreductase [Candidatus Cloacimonadota bacterium]
MAKLLITGITGFIGREVLKELLPLGHEIWALIRPGTAISRYQAFKDDIKPAYIDLADIQGLKAFLAQHSFDIIVHIGALRGGRKENRKKYYQSNVGSTQQFVDYSLKKGTKLIFCSSVGVFGAIPSELPANAQSSKNPDNYYHYTKIECEKIIGKAVLHGLKAMIIRPSITYGRGDKGFPYQLVKLVAGYRFPLIKKQIWIHLCHIDALVAAFVWAVKNDFSSGLSINVADREPVRLSALVDFISRQLHQRNYPHWLSLDRHFFALGEAVARFIKNELFISRFELISKSWFYDVQTYYKLMEAEGKQSHYTIPGIQLVIDYYKGK